MPWLNKSLWAAQFSGQVDNKIVQCWSTLKEHAHVVNTHLEVWPLALLGVLRSRSSTWSGRSWSWLVSRCRCSGGGRRYPPALYIYHLLPSCCELPQCDKMVCLFVCGLQEPIGWQRIPRGTALAGVMLQKEMSTIIKISFIAVIVDNRYSPVKAVLSEDLTALFKQCPVKHISYHVILCQPQNDILLGNPMFSTFLIPCYFNQSVGTCCS